MSEGADGLDGLMIEYKAYRMVNGEMQIITDQIAYTGSLAAFKRDPQFKGAAVQRYTCIFEGEMDETSMVLVNEELKPLPSGQKLDPAIAGAIDPRMMSNAPAIAQMASGPTAPLNIDLKPKILKDGDSFIKIEGNKVSRLVWVKYDDETQPFDQRVRLRRENDVSGDPIMEITKWQSLEEADAAQ